MTTQVTIPTKVQGWQLGLGLEGRQAAAEAFSRHRRGKVTAEYEAEPISERTKAALAAAKARVLQLGSTRSGQ